MIHHIYSILYLLPQNDQVRHTAQLYISVDCAKKLFSIGNNWLLSPSLAMLKHALSSYFEMDWCGYQWSYTHCFYLLYIPVSTWCSYQIWSICTTVLSFICHCGHLVVGLSMWFVFVVSLYVAILITECMFFPLCCYVAIVINVGTSPKGRMYISRG